MAEPLDLAPPADAPALERVPMRDEAGAIRPEFVEEITRCIKEEHAPFLREVVAELHEADLGDLIAALGAEDRVRLVDAATGAVLRDLGAGRLLSGMSQTAQGAIVLGGDGGSLSLVGTRGAAVRLPLPVPAAPC